MLVVYVDLQEGINGKLLYGESYLVKDVLVEVNLLSQVDVYP